MGRIIDGVKNKSKEGSDSFNKGSELGRKAVSEVKNMKNMIDSLPTDVDDEILAATKAVEAGTKGDAEHYMHSEVNSNLENGKKNMDSSNEQANEQVKNNEQVQNTFHMMDSIASFGQAARAEGSGKIEQSTAEFNNVIQENIEITRKAEDEYNKNLSEISSTF